MKQTSLLINNFRAVLLAALTSGIVGTVNGQQLHPVTPTSPLPESGRFGGTGQAVHQQGCLPTTCSMLPPKKDTGKDEARLPQTQKCPVRSNRHTTRRLRTRAVLLRFEKHAAGTSRDARRYNGRAKPGRLQTNAPLGQTGAYGGATLGQVPGDAKKTPYGQARKSGSKAASSGKKRQYESATSGKTLRVQRRIDQPNTHLRQRNEERKASSSDSGDTYTDQSHGYGATTARQNPLAAKDSTSGDERQTSAQGSAQGSPKSERPLTRRAPQRSAHMGMLARQSSRQKKSRRKIPMKELN